MIVKKGHRMSNEIMLIAQFEIDEGKIDEFKELYNQGIELVKQSEPDISYFSLYINQDETVVCSVEMYRDSQAILKHFEYSSERIPKILEICRVTNVEVYGNVTDEVKELLSPYGTKFYNYSIAYQR
jgi:quinol monooxygenase YgiN